MKSRAAGLGISYEEYFCRLCVAGNAQREWVAALLACGWGPNDNPTDFLHRLNNRTT